MERGIDGCTTSWTIPNEFLHIQCQSSLLTIDPPSQGISNLGYQMLTPGTAVDFHHDTTKAAPPAPAVGHQLPRRLWEVSGGKRSVNEGLMIQVYMIHDDC